MRQGDSWGRKHAYWLTPAAVFLGVCLLVASTIPDYGLTWDEPPYFRATDLEIQWLTNLGRQLFHPQFAENFRDEVIVKAWRWDPYQVPHPPLSRLLSGLTKTLFSPLFHPFTAYRLSSTFLFGLLASLLYVWMASLFDATTGLFAAATLLLMPNLFGFAHFAVTDIPLTSLWFLTVYAFWRGVTDWKWSLVLGVVWGLALSTKFPALLIPIPLLLWAHLYHRSSYSNNLISMMLLSPLVMIALQPYLWHQPFVRVAQFVYEAVNRGYRPETNFPVYFAHSLYVSRDLPWYYMLLMTAITIPDTILILVVVGLLAIPWARLQRATLILFLFNAFLILGLGLLPGAVLHDVNRMALPSLPFFAALGAYGFFLLTKYLAERLHWIASVQRISHLRAKIIGVVAVLALIPPASDLVAYHPYELSYYNRWVGGIRGAFERGFEVTYYMEALTPKFIQFLNGELPPNAVVNAASSNFMLQYYQRHKRLRPDIRIADTNDSDYYILLNRKSFFSQEDWLVFWRNLRPYAAVELQGVPLVSMYKLRDEPARRVKITGDGARRGP